MPPNLTIQSFNSYYDRFRKDIIDAVPSHAKKVLSVGCAAGSTEAKLVERGIEVVGVEINHEAAKIARQRGLAIIEGSASEVDVCLGNESYDCLIYADILEHLSDPLIVLKKHVKYLKTGGIVYVCIPNFRHYSVFWQLFVRGRIVYKDAGILDKTHIRITTRKMVLDWFKQVNLEVINTKYIIWRRRNRLVSFLSLGLFRDIIAEQVRIIAKKL